MRAAVGRLLPVSSVSLQTCEVSITGLVTFFYCMRLLQNLAVFRRMTMQGPVNYCPQGKL